MAGDALPRLRVLFVDDEQGILDGLATALRRMRRVWDMHFECGGGAAVEQLRAEQWDALVTDMRMPGVDGEQVLAAARAHCPGTVRIVLSGQTDPKALLRTVGLAHAFLTKPCGAEEVQQCLQQLLATAGRLDPLTRQLVCGVGHLPTQQQAVQQVFAVLDLPDSSLGQISQCCEGDPALVAKILHAASAGFFAKRQNVSGVEQALEVLGHCTLRGLLQAAPTATSALAEHAARCAKHGVQSAAVLTQRLQHQEAWLCGLLHGLGKLVLLERFGDAYAQVLDGPHASCGQELEQLELSQFGTSHNLIASHLLQLWGASDIAAAIGAHLQPEQRAGLELSRSLYEACETARNSDTWL